MAAAENRSQCVECFPGATGKGFCSATFEDVDMFVKNMCVNCEHNRGSHMRAASLLASSRLSRKRKSLPPPVSGSDWNTNYLKQLHISIFDVDESTVLGVGHPYTGTSQSAAAKALLQSCEAIDDASVKGEIPRVVRTGTGWTLLKYLRLIAGPQRLGLESVIDDFVIHLLAALGFNDGNLVILSKNNLKFQMNSKNPNVHATADVTVYDVARQFRLAVFEDKPDQTKAIQPEDYEAQLVAEAIAAAQANLHYQEMKASTRKRAKSESDVVAEGGHVSASAVDLPVSPGPLYLIRVVGNSFSFYSTELSPRFLQFVADYKNEEDIETLPETIVYKLSTQVTYAASETSAPETVTKTTWEFYQRSDRACIIRMLDQILQILQRTKS